MPLPGNQSQDRAEALRITANAEAEKCTIEAKAMADAEVLKTAAAEKSYSVEAAGQRSLNEAHNTLSENQIAMQIRMALIKYMPEIIRESVKPMEQIDAIKIIQVDGLNAGTTAGSHNGDSSKGDNLADQLVTSALRYRGQAPLVDSLLADIGLKADSVGSFTSCLVGKPVEEAKSE